MKNTYSVVITIVMVVFTIAHPLAQVPANKWQDTIATVQCVPTMPTGLFVSKVRSCKVKLNWKSCPDVSYYKVRYRTASTAWSTPKKTGTDTFFVFSNLTSATAYTFNVASFCSATSRSPWASVSATTASCASILSSSVEFTGNNAVHISVSTDCNSGIYYFRYKLKSSGWIISSTNDPDRININNLHPDSTYFYQLSACSDTLNSWSAMHTFQMPDVEPGSHPNIILIILDDAMYNVYSCNGAPSFFHTPNIDRIANEGVNFRNSFVVTSLCMPSRSVIATGLFPTRTNVFNNEIATSTLDTSFVVLSERLRPEGYYSALVGKNHYTFALGTHSEFDYSMLCTAVQDNYGSHRFDLNGEEVHITGNASLIMGDTVAALIERTQNPLFVWMAFRVPHYPMKPMEPFEGRYQNYAVPFGADTAQYTHEYPSFLDDLTGMRILPSSKVDSVWHVMYEVIGGVDSAIGHILNALDASGKTNNTLVIFTSDNGFLMGIHGLNDKAFAYEPSMRVPLFVRYPKWFAPAVIKNSLALNLDIAPTVLEAARIDNVPLDGISLRKFYSGDTSRSEFYYLMKEPLSSNQVTWRAIRDFNYKYVSYCCASVTEEFFDMHSDTLELNNLINDSQYQSLIADYRNKLTTYQAIWDDTLPERTIDCFLVDGNNNEPSTPDEIFSNSRVSEELMGDAGGNICILNMLGQIIFIGSSSEVDNKIEQLPEGNYILSSVDSQKGVIKRIHVNK